VERRQAEVVAEGRRGVVEMAKRVCGVLGELFRDRSGGKGGRSTVWWIGLWVAFYPPGCRLGCVECFRGMLTSAFRLQ